MIARLKGILDSIENDGVVIDVNGVGYWVRVSQKVLSQLQSGEPASFWIEHIIRQDEMHLCGFLEKSDRLCFRQLLNVQGVGVRVALAILSVLSVDELILAISAQDKKMLTRADGVGPKLAERILLEMKGRLSAPALSNDSGSHEIAVNGSSLSSTPGQDALLGLINLGYGRSEAHQAIMNITKDHEKNTTLTSSDILRMALKSLARF